MDFLSQARDEYESARRKARRAYDAHVAQGRSGQLPFLDEVRQRYPVIAEVRMGLLEVPLSRIVGTYSASRASTFASNFLPLAPAASEFGQKWIHLCAVHLEEGIRHPVKVYEYLGKYYCMEGNKRISVLKHFGAFSITAEVLRLVPQRDDSNPKIRQYYKYLEYAKDGLFPGLYMEQPHSYSRLRTLEARLFQHASSDEKAALPNLLERFEQAFDMMELELSCGDAFLEYLQIYGKPEDLPLSEIRARIDRLLPQLRLAQKPTQPSFSMEETENRQSLLSRILPWKRRLVVGFAYMNDSSIIGSWSHAHECGKNDMLLALGDRVECTTAEHLKPDTAYPVLRKMLENGVDLLFVTNSALIDVALRVALEFPKSIVMVCAPAQPTRSVVTYFGRYHEAMFLSGVAAGMASASDLVGYVTADLAVRKDTMDINAFALGLQTVNPRAKVQLMFLNRYTAERSRLAVEKLGSLGADVAMVPQVLGHNLPLGCFSFLSRVVENKASEFLAAPRWNWGQFYTSIIESVLSGSLETLHALYPDGRPVVHFWWGLGTGVLDFYTAPFLPGRTADFLGHIRSWVADGTIYPFAGPIIDKNGTQRAQAQESLDPARILGMKWLADNVLLPGEDR